MKLLKKGIVIPNARTQLGLSELDVRPYTDDSTADPVTVTLFDGINEQRCDL